MKPLFDFLKATKTQAYLAYTILIGGGLIIEFGHLQANDNNRILDLMFLSATFYFGSSKSGASKDETIATLAGNPTVTGDKPTVNVVN